MNFITEKKLCTGCTACKSICSRNAINMVPDSLGFLYPKINNEKCIDCGLCVKTCPVNGKKAENEIIDTFGVINKDDEIRLKSSSGGVFSSLAKYIISNGGVVFGVVLDEKQNAIFSKATSYDQLEPMYGSKYVQASLNNSLEECKKELEKGKKVLFVGTPCQIGGLQSYLKKTYDNLIIVDFICHGVPSPALWQKYISYQENVKGLKVQKAFFRNKNSGWRKFSLELVFSDFSRYTNTLDKDKYLQLFLKDNCLRESCYNCFAKGVNRFSDITIADFWGVQNILPQMDDNKGTSVVCVNTVKGKQLFSMLKENIDCISFDRDYLIQRQRSLTLSCKRTERRDLFEKQFGELNINYLYKKFGRDSLEKRIRRKISVIKNGLLKK